MILWTSLLVCLALVIAATIALWAAMLRAERRARRTLYRALGLGEAAADLLMARNRDVISELALLRLSPAGSDVVAPATATSAAEHHETPAGPDAPSIRPPPGPRPARPGETRSAATTARRVPYASRHRRL